MWLMTNSGGPRHLTFIEMFFYFGMVLICWPNDPDVIEGRFLR